MSQVCVKMSLSALHQSSSQFQQTNCLCSWFFSVGTLRSIFLRQISQQYINYFRWVHLFSSLAQRNSWRQNLKSFEMQREFRIISKFVINRLNILTKINYFLNMKCKFFFINFNPIYKEKLQSAPFANNNNISSSGMKYSKDINLLFSKYQEWKIFYKI